MNNKTSQHILKKVVDDYNSISADFDKTRKTNWQEFELFLNFIKDNDNIADIGCGNGRLCNFLRKHKRIKYTGIDNSEGLLTHAKKNIKADFMLGDLTDIPLSDHSMDVITAIAAFHHLPNKKLRSKSLEEMSRVLKKDGKLIISVWNLFQDKYKKYIWKARKKYITSLGKYGPRDTFIPWAKTGINRYYYAFKTNELKNLLEENGFKVILEHTARNILFICKKS